MSFALHNAQRTDLFPELAKIATHYFSLDTASPETALGWYTKNPYCLISASHEGRAWGYADFLPLTPKAQRLIEERILKEEDITPDHILAPEEIRQCRALYFAGMAVRDHHNVGNARCVAALLSGIFHMLENIYAEAPLEFLFANPTTYTGNRLIMRLGFTPISYRKIKMGGMDLYMLVLTEERRAYFKNLQQRYARFVSSMDWMTS